MNLINDVLNNTWYWVLYEKPDYPMSPEFDDETNALMWRGQIAKENFYDWEEQRKQLDRLYSGEALVIPNSIEHATAMMQMASFYLDNTKNHESSKNS